MSGQKKSPDQLRSARWFAPDDLRSFGHRSRVMQIGYSREEWQDRPLPGRTLNPATCISSSGSMT
jgi:hypothetical protein